MSIDPDLLAEYSRFVDWEGEHTWVTVPADPLVARNLRVDARWLLPLTANVRVGECVSKLWKELAPMVPRTSAALSAKTTALALLQTRKFGVSLIYFVGRGDDMVVRRGYSPSNALPGVSDLFPIDLKLFYQLHDGFVNFMSHDGGPLPALEWRTVVDPESGGPSLVKIAMDGSEAFGFDVSESPAQGYVLRPSDGEVEAVMDAWAFLDDLMASYIEDV
jgi:hypothetical protein